jgi:DNA-binding response OmpR family regulator
LAQEEQKTIDGMEWPIVLLVELAGAEIDALTRALQEENVLVLVEESMPRAVLHVSAHRPHVVVARGSLPAERTQALRDAARDANTEVVLAASATDTTALRAQIGEALARAITRRARK